VQDIQIAGVIFSYDRDRAEEMNYGPILICMARKLNDWRGRNLSVLGKVLVSKAQGMSQLIFIATMTMVPDWVIKQATSLLFKFIWGGPDKITRQLACQNYDVGGLRAPNLHRLIDALHGTWITRFCKTGNHNWKIVMTEELNRASCDIHCLTSNFAPKIAKQSRNLLEHSINVWSCDQNSK